ncbi:hypothetical protein AMAG_13268 [Allomyces macrogynus ATCC 38327]|uniref:Ion transport domain-containing protein n=1 Tax=Allomyces macrogynus (strain ATCC 38327) TaxID=578462 RepID=A0A0L0T0J4_ALLM3|nr:hypothetical protein AMAG_13268 [Allomyces macrogynus ATCC 38327]|eukprot:KNE68099.1 hypothetical protein AMAG_13268 [Allomyces macrogynus ATCC 38327]
MMANSKQPDLAAALQARSGGPRPNHSILRSSLEVELTYPAFRLPGVFDRKFESNFLYTNADSSAPRHFHRVFYQHSGFPTNRKYSLIGDKLASVAARYPLAGLAGGSEEEARSDGGVDDPEVGGNVGTSPSHPAGRKKGVSDLMLIGMGGIGGRNVPVDDGDNTDSYSMVRRIIFGNARKMNVSRLERKDINFSTIVDIDDEAFESYVTDDLAGRLGEGDFFRLIMLMVIIFNSIMISLQTNTFLRQRYSGVFAAMDSIFLSIFIMEVLFKWYYAFVTFWKSPWNWLDLGLIVVALLGPLITFSSSSRILKMLRMIRAFRSLRGVSALAGMYTVLQTVFQSIPDMLNITLLLLIVMFIFAVVGVTLFSSSYPERFGDLGTAMMMLFILVCQDGWVGLFNTMESRGLFGIASIYCVIFITLGGFIFLNLITAVVVNNLETTYDNIKKQMRRKYRQLKSAVGGSGTSGSGTQRPLATVAEGDASVYLGQIPYELPEFDRITESKLEKYYLLLMVIEENLKEYVQIKQSLNEILREIKDINADRDDGDEDLDADMEEDEEEPDMNAGDALTRLINLQNSRNG